MKSLIVAQIEAQSVSERAAVAVTNAHVVDVAMSVLYLLRECLTHDSYYMHVMSICHAVDFMTADSIYSAIARHIVRTSTNQLSMRESVYTLRSDIRLLVS